MRFEVLVVVIVNTDVLVTLWIVWCHILED
jgi:hypothetical protein